MLTVTHLRAITIVCFVLLDGSLADEVCEVKEQRITCQYDIPRKIPPGVNEIYVENHKTIDIDKHMFGDPSWKNILNLQIYQNKQKTNSIHVYDNAFRGLHNLNVLGVHSRGFSKYDIRGNNIFHGLENITELDFSGCVNLYIEFITSSLMHDGEFLNLRTLILNGVNTNAGNRFINFSQPFTNMLIRKQIEKLSLRNTMIYIQSFNKSKSSKVSYLDISDTSFFLLPKINELSFALLNVFKNLKQLNISQLFQGFWIGNNILFSNLHLTYCINVLAPYFMNLFYIEELYANNIFTNAAVPAGIINSTLNLTCRMNLRVLELRGNNIQRIQATLLWPDKNFLRHIDLSDNKMIYLSPNATRGLYNLKTLLLAENLLSEMCLSPEFIDLFANCYNLEKLVLDRNGFTYLPESTFLQNKFLSYLSLKGNLMKQVTFNVGHLTKLEHLDLSNNLIRILDEQSLDRLNDWILLKANFSLNLEGNPIICTCKSAHFIRWINNNVVPRLDKGAELKCTLEGKTVIINAKTVAQTQFLCIRTMVYVVVSFSTLLVVVLTAVLFLTVSRVIKRRRQTGQVQKFLNRYSNRQAEEKFLCLLSYSNTDSEVVVNNIYTSLNETFKQLTGLESDTVCIDERHFRAGAEIVAEIIRCVSESCVIVFVVSRSFCQSSWCCLEIKEAYEQQKPAVLIFSEDVDEHEMPANLKQMFHRYTRAKLVMQDEDIDIRPGGWKGFCESIILLASRHDVEKK